MTREVVLAILQGVGINSKLPCIKPRQQALIKPGRRRIPEIRSQKANAKPRMICFFPWWQKLCITVEPLIDLMLGKQIVGRNARQIVQGKQIIREMLALAAQLLISLCRIIISRRRALGICKVMEYRTIELMDTP